MPPRIPNLYHRIQNDSTQTPAIAQLQKTSGEIWGAPRKGGTLPSVKAYYGSLPSNEKGIEFVTPVPCDPKYSSPVEAHWYHPHTLGVQLNSKGFAFIPATVVKIV